MTVPDAPRPRQVSTQLVLVAIVAALIGPGLVFTGLLISRYEASERTAYDQQARNIARQVANAIDRDLAGLTTTLQTLATSAQLESGDGHGLYDQATAVKALVGADISVRTEAGEAIVDTMASFGPSRTVDPLPIDQRVIQSGRPMVSDVFAGSPGQAPVFAVVAPSRPAGRAHRLLQVTASTDRIAAIIGKDLPAGWVIGVGDREGTYVARSDRHRDFAGKPGSPDFISQLIGEGGSFTSRSPFGEKILVGYARSAESGWSIAASIPRQRIEAPLRRDLVILALSGGVALVLSTLLTSWLWSRIAGPLRILTRAGRDIGTAGADFAVRTPLREIASLSDAMASASAALLDRDEARTLTQAALQDSEARLQRANEALEARVVDRTRELNDMNGALRSEMEAREAAEGQLRQVQKMEAIGQLSGGIAHDFNNMLAIIVGGLNLAKTRLERGDTNVMRFIDAAAQGAERAAALTSRLLAYARQQPLSPQPVDANALVANTTELLRRTLGEDVRLETILAAGLWPIHVDAGQLESAILNLAVNARDAMAGGGRLLIETSNVAASQAVRVAVTDSGSGMTADVAAKAFDPFFTTKDVGKGTGLGLSQVYGFVRQSGGQVTIRSRSGEGTSVEIDLPRYVGTSEAAPARPDGDGIPLARDAAETILVVEDDSAVRQVAVDALAELGYCVLPASTGDDALRILASGSGITLLLTDIMMPGMDGRRLADEMRRLQPDLPVLFMTGFMSGSASLDADPEPGMSLLHKPFTLAQLATRVRRAIDGAAPSGSAGNVEGAAP